MTANFPDEALDFTGPEQESRLVREREVVNTPHP